MPIECEVVPRDGASPEDLKRLGNALLRWYVRERERGGIADSLDAEALAALLNGRLPAARRRRSAVTQPPSDDMVPSPVYLGGYEIPLPDVRRLQAALAAAVQPVAVLRVRRAGYDWYRTVACLRQYILPELVQDIRVEGISWDEGPDHPSES